MFFIHIRGDSWICVIFFLLLSEMVREEHRSENVKYEFR
jgi:hypothetical protein